MRQTYIQSLFLGLLSIIKKKKKCSNKITIYIYIYILLVFLMNTCDKNRKWIKKKIIARTYQYPKRVEYFRGELLATAFLGEYAGDEKRIAHLAFTQTALVDDSHGGQNWSVKLNGIEMWFTVVTAGFGAKVQYCRWPANGMECADGLVPKPDPFTLL